MRRRLEARVPSGHAFALSLTSNALTARGQGHGPGPLQGCTVNVTWYLKQEGLLDMTKSSTTTTWC
jgi:hypothetical protein